MKLRFSFFSIFLFAAGCSESSEPANPPTGGAGASGCSGASGAECQTDGSAGNAGTGGAAGMDIAGFGGGGFGDAGEDAGAGGSVDAGGDGGAGAAGSDGGSSGDAGVPDSSLSCEEHASVFGGGSLTGSFFLDPIAGISFKQGAEYWRITVPGQAVLYLSGSQPEPIIDDVYLFYAFEPGSVLQIDTGVVYLSQIDAEPGTVYCAGAGSTLTVGQIEESHIVELTGVGLLGSCPGTPVSGELTGCFSTGNGCESLTGTLDGETFDTSIWNGHLARDSMLALYRDGTFVKLWRSDASTQSQGDLAYAFVFTPLDGPHGGAVYCAGPGSTYDDDNNSEFIMKNLSVIGKCSGATGSETVQGCLWE
jgi:hypothetical protein